MEPISLKDLLEAGCHFGHKADRWHPKASQFIFAERDGIHIIDLAKTKSGLEAAAQFLYDLAKSGKKVLFVGTKRQAAPIIREHAKDSHVAYLTQRWVGGFFTNWDQVHKNLEKIRRLTEEENTGVWKKYPKHERVKLSRYVKKLLVIYGGVVDFTQVPDALFVVDIKREKVAVEEARKIGIPVLAIVDTNANPSDIDYVIPSNDDAVGAISCIVSYLTKAFKEGYEAGEKEADRLAAKVVKEAEKLKKPEGQTPEVKPEAAKKEVEVQPEVKKAAVVEKPKKARAKKSKEEKVEEKK